MKTVPPLPQDIAEAWFHVTAGGEAYWSILSRGSDLRRVIGELMFGGQDDPILDDIMTELADPDWWGRHDGQAVQGSIACGEDPDIELRRITEPKLIALLAANNFQTGSIFAGR